MSEDNQKYVDFVYDFISNKNIINKNFSDKEYNNGLSLQSKAITFTVSVNLQTLFSYYDKVIDEEATVEKEYRDIIISMYKIVKEY